MGGELYKQAENSGFFGIKRHFQCRTFGLSVTSPAGGPIVRSRRSHHSTATVAAVNRAEGPPPRERVPTRRPRRAARSAGGCRPGGCLGGSPRPPTQPLGLASGIAAPLRRERDSTALARRSLSIARWASVSTDSHSLSIWTRRSSSCFSRASIWG